MKDNKHHHISPSELLYIQQGILDNRGMPLARRKGLVEYRMAMAIRRKINDCVHCQKTAIARALVWSENQKEMAQYSVSDEILKKALGRVQQRQKTGKEGENLPSKNMAEFGQKISAWFRPLFTSLAASAILFFIVYQYWNSQPAIAIYHDQNALSKNIQINTAKDSDVLLIKREDRQLGSIRIQPNSQVTFNKMDSHGIFESYWTLHKGKLSLEIQDRQLTGKLIFFYKAFQYQVAWLGAEHAAFGSVLLARANTNPAQGHLHFSIGEKNDPDKGNVLELKVDRGRVLFSSNLNASPQRISQGEKILIEPGKNEVPEIQKEVAEIQNSKIKTDLAQSQMGQKFTIQRPLKTDKETMNRGVKPGNSKIREENKGEMRKAAKEQQREMRQRNREMHRQNMGNRNAK